MEQDILEQLYRRHYARALLYATALCGDGYMAEDLVSDAFVKAYLSLPDDTPNFEYWLLRVIKNAWLDLLRRQKFAAPSALPDHLADPNTPENAYLTSERHRCLWAAIGTLSAIDREIVTLHYFSQIPLSAVATITGRDYAAVRQRLSRLRRILKKRMEEMGYGF